MNTSFFSTRHVTPTADRARPDEDHSGDRALVLGGGGATGNAWSIGVIAGLFEAGLDVTQADLVIGTSAGSTTAVQVTSTATPTELFAGTLTAPSPQRTSLAGPDGGRARVGQAAATMDSTAAIIAAAADPADMRRRLGEAALELDATSDGSGSARWRAVVAARLPSQEWPERAVLITAVDASTGEPVVFDRSSGIALADAVAASCSSGPAYRVGERRFIDGGYRRSAENADLAVGYGRVLVLSPFGGRTRAPLDWGMQLAAQVEELRAGGSEVETIAPDSDPEHMFGANAVDLSLRPAAARAGRDQGILLAERLADFWH